MVFLTKINTKIFHFENKPGKENNYLPLRYTNVEFHLSFIEAVGCFTDYLYPEMVILLKVPSFTPAIGILQNVF